MKALSRQKIYQVYGLLPSLHGLTKSLTVRSYGEAVDYEQMLGHSRLGIHQFVNYFSTGVFLFSQELGICVSRRTLFQRTSKNCKYWCASSRNNRNDAIVRRKYHLHRHSFVRDSKRLGFLLSNSRRREGGKG